MPLIVDHPSRERAATASDRNIVVTAGAGTGKTTLLVERLLHLLLVRDPALSLNEIVALTFTNKAANEMKVRLRAKLLGLRDHPAARAALTELEQSQIGTIHSFAAHLLRLYPIEGGVDPSFQQDEGSQFDDHFTREWATWLDGQLEPAGREHAVWRQILASFPLDHVTLLAKSLCSEMVPLESLAVGASDRLPVPMGSWFLQLAERADALVEAHEKRTTIDVLLGQAATFLREVAARGLSAAIARADALQLDRGVPPRTTQWSEAEYRRAKQVLRTARGCLTLKDVPLRLALDRLVPFAAAFRRSFLATGYVSFDGLLARCRTMLRDYPEVRRHLKARFRSILVDEFQDTDPVQYELILYLAEEPGTEAADWRTIRLEPGKLFIVGDPKQSIYAFRRADIEAYDRVVQERVLGQEPAGEMHKLQTNFRSHRRLLGAVNAFFSGLFPPVPDIGVQPQHDPLEPALHDETVLEQERVELRLVAAADDERDAESTTRAEAEELARWLAEEVIGKHQIMERGAAVLVQPGHIAVLFRTLGPLREYVDAFRRHAIPCQAEGERHFYERQEVLDTVNLLRAAANPHDKLALVGVLRSAFGALTDAELASLACAGLLDYRVSAVPADGDAALRGAFERVQPVYGLLRDLHRELPLIPVPDVLPTLFTRLPLLELAAASMDRDHAVGNLLKLRDLATDLAQRPLMTFPTLVREFTRRITDVPEEAEMSLTEEETEAEQRQGVTRLMSMHKAKGLEFPVVVLAGLHRVPNRQSETAFVHYDWSTGITGVRVGSSQTVGGLYTGAKLAERRWAEHSRLLYVGMTRAKRKLVLSAGLPKSVQADSFLGCIANRLELDLQALGTDECDQAIVCGDETIALAVRTEQRRQARPVAGEADRWRNVDGLDPSVEAQWHERGRRYAELSARPMFLSPTMLQAAVQEEGRGVRHHGPAERTPALRVGTLAHRLLERWDFGSTTETCRDQLNRLLEQELAGEPEDERSDLREALLPMLTGFVASPVYRDLGRAVILGREVPFLMPWGEDRQVMSGTIDLLYRLDGRTWIADYKTDALADHDAATRAESYRLQADIYRTVVAQTLGLESVSFQFIFLRPGLAVTVEDRRG